MECISIETASYWLAAFTFFGIGFNVGWILHIFVDVIRNKQ